MGSRSQTPSDRSGVTKRTAQATIRLIVVHDHPGVRTGLSAFLGHEPDIEVVRATTCGRHVLDMVAELHPDLVLMQRAWGGIEAAKRLIEVHPGTRVAIVSAAADAQCRTEAARSGALGVVDLTTPPAEIAGGLRRLVRETPNGPVHVDATTAGRPWLADYLLAVAQNLARIGTTMSTASAEWRAAGADGEPFEVLDGLAVEIGNTVTAIRSMIPSLLSAWTLGPPRFQPLDTERARALVMRIARDLHDGPIQNLAGILFQLTVEATCLRREASGQEGELREILETSAAGLQQVILHLRQPYPTNSN